jgi:F-type H+-transporting ATPase subunit a
MFFNPFEQFTVTNFNVMDKQYSGIFSFFNHQIYVTSTLIICIFIVVLYIFMFILLSFRKKRLSKSIILNFFKLLYDFMYNLISSYLPEEGRIYFPFFFYLFLFIRISNLIGILPYAFTITSHLSITFALSFIIWFSCLIIGFQDNGLGFFSLFFPRGIPFRLVPFLVAIELISYIFRSVSLALRLFANIVAGHILLDTLALFIHKMLFPATITFSSVIIAVLPFIMCIVLILFECVVAVLQGYIFVVLSRIYLKDTYGAQSH